MIAILLAAGVGKRLGHDRPKVLLEIGGRTLLDRHLENLRALELPFKAVTGFRADLLAPSFDETALIHNPEYERGSLLSLRCALEDLDDDVVIMDADVLYHSSILADVMMLDRGFALDVGTEPGEEEMMLGVRAGRVRCIRRGRREGFEIQGEGVGFFKLDRPSIPVLRDVVEDCDPEGDYEAALDVFVGAHGADYVEVAGRPWCEIDFPEDVVRAEREILPRLG